MVVEPVGVQMDGKSSKRTLSVCGGTGKGRSSYRECTAACSCMTMLLCDRRSLNLDNNFVLDTSRMIALRLN